MKKKSLIVFLLLLSLIVFAADKNVSKVSKDFYKAVGDGNIEQAKKYLSEGADINANAGGFGWTALMKIVFGKQKQGQIEMLKFLLDNKANVNTKNDFQQTALHIAVASDTRLEEIKLLVNAGSEINAVTETGATPLINAAFWDNASAVEYLISKKANINIKNKAGDTALMTACQDKKGTAVADLLIKAGADLNIKNSKGETALSLAKKKGINDTVDLLTKAGAKE